MTYTAAAGPKHEVTAGRPIGDGMARFGFSSTGHLYHHRYVLPAIADLLPRKRGLSALDAGCGNGSLTAWLAKRGLNVTGIDVAEDGIVLARSRYLDIKFYNRSVYDSIVDLRPVNGWDVIITSEVIEHLYAPARFVANVYDNLAPGGYIIVTTPYHGYVKNLALSLANGWDSHFHVHREGGHIKFFSNRSLTELLHAAGFNEVVFRNAGRLPWLWKSIVCRAQRPADAGR